MDDIERIKKFVEPLARKMGGFFAGRILNAITEENVKVIYESLGEQGVRDATEALIRIGKKESDNG